MHILSRLIEELKSESLEHKHWKKSDFILENSLRGLHGNFHNFRTVTPNHKP